MKLYFDNILFHLQRSGGGSVHWGELMKRFNTNPLTQFIEPSKQTDNIVQKEIKLKQSIKEGILPATLLRYLPLTVKIDSPSIFHSSYYRNCLQKGIVNFTTVHDFIYERFGSGLSKHVHHFQKGMAVKNSSHIICVSNTTKKDLLHYFPGAAKKKIEVIYNGVSDDFKIIDKNSIDENFQHLNSSDLVLYVGHRTSYKNFNFAATVVSALPGSYQLIIVGNKFSDEEKVFLDKMLPGRYQLFTNATNDQLNQLYNIAKCLLYPSSYEGFGIPIIEAFKCKCPVVAQNNLIVNEIAGAAALKGDGLVLKDFVDNILSLNNRALKDELIEQGLAISKRFSWERCYQETAEFYNTI